MKREEEEGEEEEEDEEQMFRDVEFLPEMLNPDNAQFMSCWVEILKI